VSIGEVFASNTEAFWGFPQGKDDSKTTIGTGLFYRIKPVFYVDPINPE
jgi:hypothetical protein